LRNADDKQTNKNKTVRKTKPLKLR